jgi:multiple sugar transport system substrate-binding protein
MRFGRYAWAWPLVLVSVASAMTGCSSGTTAPAASAAPYRGLTVTVAAIGDPAILTTVAALRGEWTATRAAEVVIRQSPADPRSLQGVDLLLFPGCRLGDLVDAGALAVLPETLVAPPVAREPGEASTGPSGSEKRDAGPGTGGDVLRFSDIAQPFRDQVSRYGSERMALPYGGTALVLVYDRAAFDRPENRAAAEKESLVLQPPQTWVQFDALARFFHGRDWDGDGIADQGVALPLGSDAGFLGEAVFLARAASLGQHHHQYSFLFDADTMLPRIDAPPFVEAARALAALTASGPPGMAGFDAEAARQAFRGGKVAMLIDRAELASHWSHGKKTIGVAPLPGSERVYDPDRAHWEAAKPVNDPSYLPFGGGWLVGVNSATAGTQRDAAVDLARYLVGPDTAKRVSADRAFPMLPVRSALLAQGPPDPRAALGVDARQWSDAVSRTLIGRRVVPGVRIPAADGYLADLAKGRAAILDGAPAESALKNVAEAWTERTKALGQARQVWHYRRSLNSLVTLPEPPER